MCVYRQPFPFHVFLSPSTKWRRRLPYAYNPAGFPSSKPAINANCYYFFTAEGTFRTLHYRSSTIHISPSPFHCVQHLLPFQITQRWLTPPDTVAVPWHGFLRYFVNATSFGKTCQWGEVQTCLTCVGRCGLGGCLVFWRFKAKHSLTWSALFFSISWLHPCSHGNSVSCERCGWHWAQRIPLVAYTRELRSSTRLFSLRLG